MRVQRISSFLLTFSLLFLLCVGTVYGKWEKLENCRLLEHGSNDGDSFRIKTKDGRQFQFRLYFVDTPEVGLFYPDRVEAQAQYFGVNADRVLRIGALSSRFTKSFLSGGTFTVWIEWKDAWGAQTRYAGLVYREDESLIEELVKNGLVRVHGFKNDSIWPGGWVASDYRKRLLQMESKARRQGIGGWGHRKLPVDEPVVEGIVEEGGNDPSTRSSDVLLDLNSATSETLQGLPGIGPVIAERIVQARPFSSVGALLNVKGIGNGLLSKLRPLVIVRFLDKTPKTAAFYLADPLEWNGREIELSVRYLQRANTDAPDGFVRMEATTAFDGKQGGVIPLYLDNESEADALNYFENSNRELILRVRFFQFHNQWITVYRKDRKSDDSTE